MVGARGLPVGNGSGRSRGRDTPSDTRHPAGRADPRNEPPTPVHRPFHRSFSTSPLVWLGIGAVGLGVAGYVGLVQRRAAIRERELLRRDRILRAVGAGGEMLLRPGDGRRLSGFLALLGEATNASRAYIFENGVNERGELVMYQRYEWVAAGVEPQIDNPQLQGASYDELGGPRWRTLLGRGLAIIGPVWTLPETEQEILRAQHILSIAVLPIFVGDEWWGFIGFDDTRCERAWADAEVDALRVSAELVAAAIEHDRAAETQRQLERAAAERAAANAAKRRARFLARVSRQLAATLNQDEILRQLAAVAVPTLGEWCLIDQIEGDLARPVAVEHAGSGAEDLARRILAGPPARHADTVLADVVLSDSPRLVRAAAGNQLRADVRVEELGPGRRDAIILPLRDRDAVVATMTLVSNADIPYTRADLAHAVEAANRASLALQTARLYHEAKWATRLRDDMLAVVSHDLRDPLNTISLSAGVIRETLRDGDPLHHKQLDIIARSVQRAERLISDLLDVVRLEAGTLRLDRRETSSGDIVREAVELHRAQAEAGGLSLTWEVAPALPAVCADHDRILQVFGNLLGNAIKFTGEGGRIHVTAEAVPGGVRFAVLDNGPGMSPEQLQRSFAPFWQARSGGGAGLGLAIARGIVEAHGGRIDADSAPGVGTTISFTIPTMAEAPREKAPPGEPGAAEAGLAPLEDIPTSARKGS